MGWLLETGRVVAIESDAVWIEAERSAACGRCAARAGCGQGALSGLLQQDKGRVRALSGDDLSAAQCHLGEHVWIRLPEAALLSGTAVIYGFPLVLGTLAAVVLSSRGDLWAAVGFCLGTFSGFTILHHAIARLGGRLPGFAEPELVRKAHDAEVKLDEIVVKH
jgi:sigma-E factor negative regulatory protein RseC